MHTIKIDTNTREGYELFLKCKSLPKYKIEGHNIITDDISYNYVFKGSFKDQVSYKKQGIEFDYQNHVIEKALERECYNVNADCGLGKGQPLGSKILTPNGWENIERLKFGDNIYDSTGTKRNVTGVFPKNEIDTYRFYYSDGSSCVFDIDHIHICRNNNERQRKKIWKTMTTKELLECGNLRYGKNNKSRNYDIPLTKPIEFNEEKCYIHPYLLGVLIADGCVNNQVVITTQDSEVIENCAQKQQDITFNKYDEINYRIITGKGSNRKSNKFRQELIDLEMYGKRSYEKSIPKKYLFNSVKNRIELLRGLMDGDSYIKSTTQYYTTSKKLKNDVLFLLRSLGANPTVSSKIGKYKDKNGMIKICKKCYTLTFSIKNINPFYLKRRAVLWNPNPRDNGRWIDRIEYEKKQKTVCISVDSPDKSYVTENFVVTHNTIINLSWAKNVSEHTKNKVLYMCPLSVVEDTQRECEKLYGFRMSNLKNESWKTDIAIMNYESRKEIHMKDVSGFVLDECSILKNGDSKTRQYLQEMVNGVRFRLAASATPAPNSKTEYATQAVWLGMASTLKEYYARYFLKDGTKWKLKGHAENAFYDNLASWACYLVSPSSLGFEQGAELKDEPEYNIIETMCDQKYLPEGSFLSKKVELKDSKRIFTELRTDKTQQRFKKSIEAVENEHSIVWCMRNEEERIYKNELKGVVINGQTPIEKRIEIVDSFRSGGIKHLITKPSVMGFGVNIPQAESHLYSGYDWSFERFYQAVRRSHRFGRVGRLKVHVPVSEAEVPVWNILNLKLKSFKEDVINLQNRFFKKKD